MTEAEWTCSTDLWAMIEALGDEASDSRLRLFACACCRRIWDCIESALHRRAVEYAEWFARGPGCDFRWVGRGHWMSRRPSRPFEEVQRTPGWATLQRELDEEQAGISEEMAALRYDCWTPPGTAASVLHFRYDMPFYVARGAASIRTAPYAYWQHDRMPQLSDEEEERWVARIDQEMASLCGLLRQVYGRPDLAERVDAPDRRRD